MLRKWKTSKTFSVSRFSLFMHSVSIADNNNNEKKTILCKLLQRQWNLIEWHEILLHTNFTHFAKSKRGAEQYKAKSTKMTMNSITYNYLRMNGATILKRRLSIFDWKFILLWLQITNTLDKMHFLLQSTSTQKLTFIPSSSSKCTLCPMLHRIKVVFVC